MPVKRRRCPTAPIRKNGKLSRLARDRMDLKDIRLYVDDRAAEGVFRVHRDAYADPELFELEQKFIFERTWNFLALESQMTKTNDFVTGHIGRTPVLVTRDANRRL